MMLPESHAREEKATAHVTRVVDRARCQHCAPVYGICCGLAGGRESRKDDKLKGCPEIAHPADEGMQILSFEASLLACQGRLSCLLSFSKSCSWLWDPRVTLALEI